jgi:hypothetical protein
MKYLRQRAAGKATPEQVDVFKKTIESMVMLKGDSGSRSRRINPDALISRQAAKDMLKWSQKKHAGYRGDAAVPPGWEQALKRRKKPKKAKTRHRGETREEHFEHLSAKK